MLQRALRPAQRVQYGMTKLFSSTAGADYHEIVNTINSFLLCIDKNKSDHFANLFTDNGTCEIVKAGAFVSGRESLKGLCDSLYTRFSPALHMVICLLFLDVRSFALTS